MACLFKKITVGEFSQYFNASSQFSESILEFATFLMNLNINGKYIDSFRDFMELESEMHKEHNIESKALFDNTTKKTTETVTFKCELPL